MPLSRRRRFSSTILCVPEVARARAENARRRGRPSRRARCPAGRRSAPAERAGGDPCIWKRARGRRSARPAGRLLQPRQDVPPDTPRAIGSGATHEARADFLCQLFVGERSGARPAMQPGVEARSGDAQRFAEPRHQPDAPVLCNESEPHFASLPKKAAAFLGYRAPPAVWRLHGAASRSPFAPAFCAEDRSVTGRWRSPIRTPPPSQLETGIQLCRM
jgi:hypothetical protein